jgi:MraZ protein
MSKSDYYTRKIDDKNRLSIPSDLAQELGSNVVITFGFGKYLHLYSQKVWDDQVEPALRGSIIDEDIANLNVKLRQGKINAILDQKQNRLTLTNELLSYGSLGKDIVIVRAGEYWRIANNTNTITKVA